MKELIPRYFVLCFLALSFHFRVDCSLSTLTFNSTKASNKFCPQHQSFALLQFNGSLSVDCSISDSTCPEPKGKTVSWKEGTDCCLWEGVKCESETGNVIGLDLSCSCLRGSISSNSTLFLLHHLQKLNLAGNDFSSSPIASQFGQFSYLTHLNISDSRFTGIIPFQISHLSKLLSLDLSNNDNLIFEGYVFEKVLRNLTQLQHLLLDTVNMSSVKFLLVDNAVEINFPKSNWTAPLQSLEVRRGESLANVFYPEIPGELPDSIGNLRSLEVLHLSFCDLKGSIPASLGNLTRLNHLDLSGNLINGPLLFSFSNFKQLSYLNLFGNSLEGPIIDSFGNLTKLRYFSVRSNNLNGHFPFSAFNLPQIEYLDFSFNKFGGPLPKHVSQLSRLRELHLDSNLLYGKIPSWLFSLPSLVDLGLSDNKLTGFMGQFDKVSPLENVGLSNNEMHGQIPSFSKLVNLTYLDLSSNKLNGNFVLDKNLNKLLDLDLSNNAFISLTSGSYVNYSLPSIRSLYLSSSNITDVPDVVRNLLGLETLDLSYNRILVMEPHIFLNLESLEYLDLSHNSALDVSNNSNVSLVLPKLTNLTLSSCNITQLPNFFASLDSLTYLDLSNNIIQGRISKEEIKWGKNLKFLDLSKNLLTALECYPWRNITSLQLGSNQLEGPFLVPPPSTIYFSISKNKLVGKIPSSICYLVSMEILDLSRISGGIPECLNPGVMKSLSVLDLSNNKFHGNIPSIFPEGNLLVTLDLNNNNFGGPLPKSLVNSHDLEVLNLGNNKINDTFPHWLGTLPQLHVLVLRANYFHGQIVHSENESYFSTLRILDLSHNGFSGFLPTSYFKSFKGMMNLSDVQMGYMEARNGYYQDSVVITMKGVDIEFQRILTIFATIDMSSNKFEGEIPELVGNLLALQVLNFSHNKLTGHIPSSLGNLAALESLDLSSNKFGGEIPMQLASLNFLEVLNLSQNQLVGPIPHGNQFNTFLKDSYEGNLGLCGFPLSKRCGPDEPPTSPVFHEESDSAFGLDWKFVLMGYGCGMVCGFSAGYIMLTLQKPKWLVKKIQELGNKVLRRLSRYS
ncbi:hypothetical protein PTKIN_Ptkin14bG0174000 [Pterospermum kingtungense]